MNIAVLDYSTFKTPLGKIHDFGYVSIYDRTSPDETLSRVESADVVITNKVVLNEGILRQCKDLKLICITATGTNNVDLVVAKELGIAVTNVAGYSTASVVEHTFALYFYIAKAMHRHNVYAKTSWSESPIFTNLDIPFNELPEKQWGIIGLGAIGEKVGDIATAFGANVSYYSTSGKNSNSKFEKKELDALLSESDIISIHAPLNENTKDLIKEREFLLMKDKIILLNVGRGGIINEQDLSKVLKNGKLGGVGLDVVETEPPQYTEFFNNEKVFLSPHIAWASVEARERLLKEVGKNIEAFLNGEARNRVEI